MDSSELFGFDSFLSPFTWRYASREMRAIFSEKQYRLLWRKIWLALANAQSKQGLVSPRELDDLKKHALEVDISQSHVIEKEIRHDVMAEVKVFASQAKTGGGKIHLGATSMDVEDNADVMRLVHALALIKQRLLACLAELEKKIEVYKNTPCMAYTHLQPAEPTTLGYRFSVYAQDLLLDLQLLEFIEENLRAKGFKGAVGTSASYVHLLGSPAKAREMESDALRELGLTAFDVSTQTYPRKQDYWVMIALASIAQSLHKFAFDVRLLQSPQYGELAEAFKEKQVGSSAMPFKRNPIACERVCSLARFVSSIPALAWDNAALSLLERTLDDSANKRVFLPQAFLATDECLIQTQKILAGLVVNEKIIEKNFDAFAPFAGVEVVLLELAKNGVSRQDAHEWLREHSLNAWAEVQEGRKNNLIELISSDKRISTKLGSRVASLMNARKHVGDAPERCDLMLKQLRVKTKGLKARVANESGF